MLKVSVVTIIFLILISDWISFVSGETCSKLGATDLNALRDWANSHSVFAAQDAVRRKKLLETDLNDQASVQTVRDRFYQVTSQTMQTQCTVGKLVGGEWLGNCGDFDGQKFVCLDKIYTDITRGQTSNCLVYSFGVADDWSFEEAMAKLGCTVRAFDPTTPTESKPSDDRITFKPLALAFKPGTVRVINNIRNNEKVKVKASTLKKIVDDSGDKGKRISYLKIDIEGSEIEGIHEWISSGILDYVDQIGIEFHTGKLHIPVNKLSETLLRLLEALRLLDELGFRIISSTTNNCVGKSQDVEKRFYTYFDLVLFRP